MWLLTWIQISGIKQGPIICNINYEEDKILLQAKVGIKSYRNGSQPIYFDNDDFQVNLTYSQLCTILKDIFNRAGLIYHGLTPYTIRKSACKWAVRCGAQDYDLKNTGRWTESSAHYMKYVQKGRAMKNYYSSMRAIDNIRRIWVFKPTTFHQYRVDDEFNR